MWFCYVVFPHSRLKDSFPGVVSGSGSFVPTTSGAPSGFCIVFSLAHYQLIWQPKLVQIDVQHSLRIMVSFRWQTPWTIRLYLHFYLPFYTFLFFVAWMQELLNCRPDDACLLIDAGSNAVHLCSVANEELILTKETSILIRDLLIWMLRLFR